MNKWIKAKLGDVLSQVIGGGTPSKSVPEYWDGDIPWASVKDIFDGQYRINTTKDTITKDGLVNSASNLIPKGTVITATRMGLGRTVISSIDIAINQDLKALIPTAEIDNQFLLWLMVYLSPTLEALGTGTTVKGIRLDTLYNLSILLPPLEIQHQIATVLSAYDDMIENNNSRIQALEQAAHDLYREWFVEFRFPDHENVPFIDSGTDYGMIPQGWEVVKLQEIADINALSINNGNIPVEIEYIDISSVSTDRVDSTQILPFKDAPGRARRIVRSGDTIWATVRPNRRSYALILRPAANLIVSTGFAVITPLKVPYSYLYKAITTEFFSDYLTNHATGSAYPAVNANDFKRADILVPKIDVAEKFHHIVADFYDQKALLEQRNNNLQKARDLLLPRLVSGQLDVNEIELKGIDT